MHLDLKADALSVHSNLGGVTHGHLELLVTNAQYALISNTIYLCPVKPVILHILNNATCVAADVLKRYFGENIRVFYQVIGVEQATIQQILAAAEEQYVTATKNREN